MKELTLYCTRGVLFQAHIHQQSQQESDHHAYQHTIYKLSQGNLCPTWRQADASAEFAYFSKAHNFIIKVPSINWK